MKELWSYYKWLIIGSFALGFLESEYCRMTNASGGTRVALLVIGGVAAGVVFNLWNRRKQ